ncbi:hypothetical protein VTN00DRAFT_7143 [Thermoascus crustaceus]|uniref:uncharacterized protein n=1 Tax=Thermoascus crustaceus TaxID=5088 RepID=UPI0037433B48
MVHERLTTRFPAFEEGAPRLTRKTPSSFMGEESYTADATLTGTTNFVHNYPALREQEACGWRGPQALHRPPLECISGQRSSIPCHLSRASGARLWRQNRAAVATVQTGMRDARVKLFLRLGESRRIWEEGGGMVHGSRSSGSAALNFFVVASGQMDVACEAGASAWDVCAGEQSCRCQSKMERTELGWSSPELGRKNASRDLGDGERGAAARCGEDLAARGRRVQLLTAKACCCSSQQVVQ